MLPSKTNLPTRTATAGASGRDRALLRQGQVIASVESGLSYRVGAPVGQGGFGQVFLARAGPPGAPRRGVHQGEPAHRRLAAGGLLRPAARRPPARDPVYDRFRDARRRARSLYCLALEYAQHGDLSAYLKHAGRRGGPRRARGARSPASSRSSESSTRPDAPPRPDADERVRLRGPPPQARGLRHRPPAERPPRRHRAHAEPAQGAERHPRRHRPQVAGARRRLPGGPAPRHAGEGRRQRAASAPPRSARCRAAIT